MPRVVLQPCSNASSIQHFNDTIESPVPIADLADILDAADIAALTAKHPSGAFPVWGAMPGENLQHVGRWENLTPGDVVLFGANLRVFAGAIITHTFRSNDAAQLLWGFGFTRNGVRQTWELMFALDSIRQLDISYSTLNALVPERKPNAVIQGFSVLKENDTLDLLDRLNYNDQGLVTSPQEEDAYRAQLADPAFAETERLILTRQRVEQAFLRGRLLPDPVGTCALCGREFPRELLVAAHIKRRSLCSDGERLQFDDVAMPACRLGCDELFGRGLVGVAGDGAIHASQLLVGAALAYFNQHLFGKTCTRWQSNVESRSFFTFHWRVDFQRPAELLPVE